MKEINDIYLKSAIKQFQYYKVLAEKAMLQLDDSQLFASVNDDTNSISTIVKHLAGNMLSRWTDFLTTDGEKEWRNRDGEFESDTQSRDEVMAVWEKGWECLFNALNSLQPNQLENIIYIRNEGHSVVDAINRQLAHYSYHVGQIVFAAKMLKETSWNSLTIPRNTSGDYNKDKFDQPKTIRHFTDAEIKKLSDETNP